MNICCRRHLASNYYSAVSAMQSVQFHDIPLISIVDLSYLAAGGCSGCVAMAAGLRLVLAVAPHGSRALACRQSVKQLTASVKVVHRKMRRACHPGRCATTVLRLQR